MKISRHSKFAQPIGCVSVCVFRIVLLESVQDWFAQRSCSIARECFLGLPALFSYGLMAGVPSGRILLGFFLLHLLIHAGSTLPQSIVDSLAALTEAAQNEMSDLESRRKSLSQEKLNVTREISKKRKRDARLLQKCARSLSPEAMMQVAANKLAARAKAKAKAAAKASP